MTGLLVCLVAFAVAYRASSRGIGHGVGALLLVGYSYGIVRARLNEPLCHFMFDAAAAGIYLERFGKTPSPDRARKVMPWLTLLIGWPCLLFLIPHQNILIQLVGLRAAIFFVPFIAIGARFEARDLDALTRWLVILNLGAFAFALAEFLVGVERFFPHNAMTDLIYRSTDVTRSHALRIPATFSSAHSYAGTMVATLPFLLGRSHHGLSKLERSLLAATIVATSLGVFMAAARLPVVILFFQLAIIAGTLRIPARVKAGIATAGAIVAALVARDERFQRFLTLRNTDMIVERVGWSVNMSFFDMLRKYPFGAGLGSAAGTSIPYFLARYQTHPPVGMENEFGRIALEQTVLGLATWTLFLAYTFTRRPSPASREWALGARLMKAYVVLSWCSALIGTGMLTAIPHTPLMLLEVGLLWRASFVVRPKSLAATAAAVTARRPNP